MANEPTIRKHHWAPYEPMVRAIERLTAGQGRVLEIGPGRKPFANSTEYVDWRSWPQLAGKPVHELNINQDSLPLADKSFDLVYCRHTLEDLFLGRISAVSLARTRKDFHIHRDYPHRLINAIQRSIENTRAIARKYLGESLE